MAANKKETIIISLGGSLVVPEQIDVEFLEGFRKTVQKHFKDKKFFIIVGGGKVCRNYMNALAEFGMKDRDREWIGIDITKLNAKVVQQIFIKNRKSVQISGGTEPGHSTDYVAVQIARKHKAKTIINLSNIDYVYTKNPKEFADAMPFEQIFWKDFQKLVGNKWTPGMNSPFDPIAAKLAAKLKIKVAMINGHKLQELENFLNNKPFIGTIIQ
jgi:uridylate kinase